MPTVWRSGPYRFFFFAGDGREPAHIHVERDACLAKYWLAPVHLASSHGFGRIELQRLQSLVDRNRERLVKAWEGYFHG